MKKKGEGILKSEERIRREIELLKDQLVSNHGRLPDYLLTERISALLWVLGEEDEN